MTSLSASMARRPTSAQATHSGKDMRGGLGEHVVTMMAKPSAFVHRHEGMLGGHGHECCLGVDLKEMTRFGFKLISSPTDMICYAWLCQDFNLVIIK
jgi:hypothetical protein